MKRRTITAHGKRTLYEELGAHGVEAAEARVRGGAVYVKGRRVLDPKVQVQPGDVLTVVLEESGRSTRASVVAPQVEVLFEDARLVAVNKPAGVVAQPTPGRAGDSLLDGVRAHLGVEPGLVHRLDKETSGVTVFGKQRPVTAALAEAFRRGQARKTYLAICGPGVRGAGVIDLPLSADPSRPGRHRASSRANGVPAVTAYEVLAQNAATTLVRLMPRTGRTHQLRAHLTALGAPITGDVLYGGAPGPRCLLHAWLLEVLDLALVAPVPRDFSVHLEGLGFVLPPPTTPHT